MKQIEDIDRQEIIDIICRNNSDYKTITAEYPHHEIVGHLIVENLETHKLYEVRYIDFIDKDSDDGIFSIKEVKESTVICSSTIYEPISKEYFR